MDKNLPKIILRKGRAGPIWAGHPWVFSGAIKSLVGEPEHGDLVAVEDMLANRIGFGHYTKDGHISIRMLTLGEKPPNVAKLLEKRIKRAIQARRDIGLPHANTTAFRLISSEGDNLPGLIVDQLGDGLVVAAGSAGMLRNQSILLEILKKEIQPSWLVFQVSKDSARMENIPHQSLLIEGEDEVIRELTILENGIQFHVDPIGGQKTGYYADQRENHRRVAELAKGKRMLDAYSYGGGFGIHAAILGAPEKVVCVDSSPRAGRLVEKNAAKNGCSVEVVVEDAISYLREKAPEEKFDLIVLDPPKFVRSRSHLKAGLKKYRMVNLLAMQAIQPGGFLITCSCSSMVSDTDFLRMLTEAGATADRQVHVLGVWGQGADHPFLAPCPESRYLKCFVTQIQHRD